MDLNRLRVFHAVFIAKSVAGAALALHVTPSAVSQALRALEKELGVRLFQRQPRGVVPTAQAESLHALYARFSDDLKTCLESWRMASNEPWGTLRVGAPPEFGSRQVITAISHFAKFKRAFFNVEFGSPEPTLARLVAGELDVVFCDSLPVLRRFKSAVVTRPVFLEKSVLVCAPGFYSREIRGDHSFAHLSKLDHVDYLPDAQILHLWYQYHFGRRPGGLRLRVIAHDVQAMITAALQGIGLAFVPEHLVAESLARKRLVVVGTGRKDYFNPIVMARLKGQVPSLLERRFVEIVAQSKS
ncbi:MAG: LysR family transcriptional regulator [Deltaproteobacteria bacterium]|nr:LysR family transcriptional regulator [Deltaproteobacteria bacterium]